MNATEFETAVRELRYRQRHFFRCKKDDPNRPKAKELMKEQEKIVGEVVDAVITRRPKDKPVQSDREQFFLNVAEMLRRQKEWMRQGGGSCYMNPSKEAEKKVDAQLSVWDEERKRQHQLRQEEERRKQTSLF